jgi:hypothetical protein
MVNVAPPSGRLVARRVAPVRLDQVTGGGEPETGASPVTRLDEALEDSLQAVLGDAGPGVGYLDHQEGRPPGGLPHADLCNPIRGGSEEGDGYRCGIDGEHHQEHGVAA